MVLIHRKTANTEQFIVAAWDVYLDNRSNNHEA